MTIFMIVTEEYARYGRSMYEPPEYGADVIEVEALNKREAAVLGLRKLRQMRSDPIIDAESDGRNPFDAFKVEFYEDDQEESTQ